MLEGRRPDDMQQSTKAEAYDQFAAAYSAGDDMQQSRQDVCLDRGEA
jgi:hypothetical protein